MSTWDLTYLPFSHQEYESRIKRAQTAVSDTGLDVLLVFHQENMYYLTNYDQIGYWVYQVLIVTPNGPVIAIVRRTNEPVVRKSPFISDVRAWSDDDPVDPAEMTVWTCPGLVDTLS